jgi:hypothetical protein
MSIRTRVSTCALAEVIVPRKGEGAPSEVQAQHDMLKYVCSADDSPATRATFIKVRSKTP